MSLSDYLENKLIAHTFGGSAFTQPSSWYVKLHTGDPGETGTSNAATETTRKSATFTVSTSTASLASTLSWTNVAAGETYSYVSIWDASTAGNCLGSGALTAAKTVAAGDSFDLTALTITID